MNAIVIPEYPPKFYQDKLREIRAFEDDPAKSPVKRRKIEGIRETLYRYFELEFCLKPSKDYRGPIDREEKGMFFHNCLDHVRRYKFGRQFAIISEPYGLDHDLSEFGTLFNAQIIPCNRWSPHYPGWTGMFVAIFPEK